MDSSNVTAMEYCKQAHDRHLRELKDLLNNWIAQREVSIISSDPNYVKVCDEQIGVFSKYINYIKNYNVEESL